MTCYCGKNESFEACCQLIIDGAKLANKPEQLMRSRYSAYANKNAKYLFKTYALSSQQSQSIKEIAQWAEQTTWLKLVVVQSDDIDLLDYKQNANSYELPTVEFYALYLEGNRFYKMQERSRFIVEDNHWRYLEGDVTEHILLATPKRNEQCLCQSNRKFKHCCALR